MQYYAVNTSSSLSHHGILGMKWGIRRYQNADGTLTAAGKERYGSKENFEKSDYYKKYRAKELAKEGKNSDGTEKTQEQLELERKKRIARNVAIGAAVAAAAIAGTAAYLKWKEDNTDVIIKGGEELQRISPALEKDLNNEFYAAFGKKDMKRYREMLPKHYGDQAPIISMDPKDKMYSLKKMSAKEDIRLAPLGTSKKIYKELAKEDPSFQKNPFGYNLFNMTLAGNHDDPNVKKFYAKLKEKGYDGLIDFNDKRGLGYKTKNPAIIINKGKVAVDEVINKPFDAVKDLDNYNKELGNVQIDKLISKLPTYGTIGAGGLSAYEINKYKQLNETQKKKGSK